MPFRQIHLLVPWRLHQISFHQFMHQLLNIQSPPFQPIVSWVVSFNSVFTKAPTLHHTTPINKSNIKGRAWSCTIMICRHACFVLLVIVIKILFGKFDSRVQNLIIFSGFLTSKPLVRNITWRFLGVFRCIRSSASSNLEITVEFGGAFLKHCCGPEISQIPLIADPPVIRWISVFHSVRHAFRA